MPINTIKMKVDMEIPLLRLADLLCEGFEGGVGYWAQIVGYEKPSELKYTMDGLSNEDRRNSFRSEPLVYKHIDYPLNAGGAIYVRETDSGESEETDKVHRLDYEACLRGLKIMNEKYPRHFAAWINETDDATTGDVFIQCALLGDIVYG